jgi:hypothetical protein
MEKVQRHHGLVCVCAECRSVIRTIAPVQPGETPLLSHGICPACAEKLYGDFFRGGHLGQTAEGTPSGSGTAL